MSRSQATSGPSSRTASGKPKGFQFIEGAPPETSNPAPDNKENKSRRRSATSRSNSQRKPLDNQTSKTNESPRAVFPSTPATRLPLSDLIGNVDDFNSLDTTAQASPEDQIQWRSARSPQTADRRNTSSQTRRVQSSSPPPSSVRTASQKARLTLQTPDLDPAADLWHRYATSSARDGRGPLQAPNFVNLVNTSSPRAVGEKAGTVSGLRRWTSCGVEWPTSKAKRRKTRHTVIREHIEEVFADSTPVKNTSQSDEAKRARIGNLINRIQESLVNQLETPEPQAPSSSSPLPERSPSVERKTLSPVPEHQDSVPEVNDNLHIRLSPSLRLPSPNMDSRSTTSFGSAEFDDTIFDAAQPNQFGVTTTNNTSVEDLHTATTIQSHHHDNVGMPEVEVAVEDSTLVNEDDFDDDLELSDIDVDDFEKIATTYENTIMIPHDQKTAPAMPQTIPEPISFGEEDFGDDMDEDDFAAAEAAATQSYQATLSQKSPNDTHPRTIQRYRVKDVLESQYTNAQGRAAPEKVIVVEEKGGVKKIHLRQSWYDTRCTEGSFVHVIGQFDEQGVCVVDDNHNMLILHPDHLISALVVADSFGCIRRAVLQDRIKATSDPSPPQTYGTMLHEIFQEAMKANRWDTDWLNNTIDMIVAQHIEDLYAIKLSIPQAVEHMRSKMSELQAWAGIFVKARPSARSTVKDRNGKEINMSINKLLDVEEHVWSPMYGLKGNIDATVQVTMQDEEGERTLVVPFEVKTGKNTSSTSHRAQTALYTLLLSDRYDISVVYGVLYYMETSEISRIPAIRQELRHMIMQRNELACYVRERLTLPPMLKTAHTCNRCYAKTSCFMYHKLAEEGDGETSGMKEKFTELVNHLKPTHQDFFKKWDDLLTKEESEMMKFKRELWTMLSTEREKHGRCFANIQLVPGTASEEINGASKINRFKYTFRRREGEEKNFSDSHISVGEPVVISDEQGHYALANGYVTEIMKRHITVAVDRRLHNARTRDPNFDASNNQVFAGIMDVEGPSTAPKRMQADTTLYRLDKDEFSNGLATVRNNLIQIMSDSVFHAREIRNFVVDDVPPRFKSITPDYALSGPASQLAVNQDQRAAIEKILTAEDYALVLGMPGTGKTTTIAHIIRALVSKGKTVLLTSYTHTAVDNILLKIRDQGIGILRLGAVAKIHPEVRQFAILGAEPKTSIEELERAYQEPQVVATTCLGINHQVFNERIFDYCIVDEASQITLPVCLGPIRMAKTFVLVGDHYQLPPLVQNREAQEGGLDISLFKLLSERHPEAVVTLRHQYRMNSDVQSISNALIYDGRLVCGSPGVANRRLTLPSFQNLYLLHKSCTTSTATSPLTSCWIHRTFSPKSTPVTFLNTDLLNNHTSQPAHEISSGSRITNALEAKYILHLTQALLLAGLTAQQIGIITPYRSQLRLITSLLATNLPPHLAASIEAHTADRFQGRDKEVVLMSFVRSNDRNVVGELLKDWRRVNVSVTRARSKMVLVGSARTLGEGDELLGKLVGICRERDWMIDLEESKNMCLDDAAHDWVAAGFGIGAGAGASPLSVRKKDKSSAKTSHLSTTVEVDTDIESPTKRLQKTPVTIVIDDEEEMLQPKQRAHLSSSTTSTATASGTATATATAPSRKRTFGLVLSNGHNVLNKAFKVPRKVAKVNPDVLMSGAGSSSSDLNSGSSGSSSQVKKRRMDLARGVLADIVNDALGGDFD